MYDKYYYEEYARLTLGSIFLYPQENFFCADKPDIQNVVDGIGIEVTRAESKTIIEREKYGSRFFGRKPTEKEIEKFDGEFFFRENGTVQAFSPTKDMANPSVFENISFALKFKKDKFDSYEKFNKMGLYCFSDCFDVGMDINKILSLNILPFDFLIITCCGVICIVKDGKYRHTILSHDKIVNIKKMARSYSETQGGIKS